MKTPQIGRSATLGGRRGIVVFVAGALASGLAISGIHAALAGGSSSSRARPDTTVPVGPASPAAPSVVTGPTPMVSPAERSPAAEPTSDPTALADGFYPTYVRAVDVRDATLTVDVLQVFAGGEAHQAAIEDGVPWKDVRYNPVYIRNENPLLRTLKVARDAHIEFLGGCEASNRWGGLTRLRDETTPFTETLYYEVTVVGGSIKGILQKIAVSAC
jgi:hypothetical protein